MRRPRRGGVAALAVIPLSLMALFAYFIATYEGPLLPGDHARPASQVAPPALPAAPAVNCLGDADLQRLGWDPAALVAVFAYLEQLSSDSLMIVTRGETVASFGDLAQPRPIHSMRKVLLSALVGQHQGMGARQIDLSATLAELGIDDMPDPLTAPQKQATVLHLVKSVSGINHAAAAEGGLVAEKNRRLGKAENTPGTTWAYNNWDTNALTTVFETRTGLSVADAFDAGIANPLGLQDFTVAAVTYKAEPALSQHRAVMFRMSARDLARFGGLYLDRGEVDGESILSASWIDRITTDYLETGRDGLRHGHGYLWWIPGPGSGLPPGTFWAWGFGQQALFVVPAWRTVIVHQADMSAFMKNLRSSVGGGESDAEDAFEELALSCLKPLAGETQFCREDRFILRGEFDRLLSLIVAARL
ncbi:serine hydrolase domain-containing protein [Pelagibius sp.]|uniref:serine hydrolase domain-containing protein n=1 Tax=Pelagibius sp. TaxID=1931238 RepID=UPI003BAF10B9